MSKKVLAVILSLILAFSVVAVPVGAADISFDDINIEDINIENFNIENVFNQLIDKLIAFVLTYLNRYWPGYEDQWVDQEEYVPEHFYTGEETFDTEVADGAKWEMGYAGASLLDGIDATSGDYFLAGTQQNKTNVFADMYAAGRSKWTSRQFQFDTGVEFDLNKVLKGLTFKTLFAMDYKT